MAASNQIQPVNSLDDPRIAAYRNLKDHELDRLGQRFIAEGELVVRRLLASRFAPCVESLLLAAAQLEKIAPLIPAGVPAYVAGADVVNRIVGFRFHSGVMACGVRPLLPTLVEQAERWPADVTLVVLPETTSPANLGSLLRACCAFGATGVLLGPNCCDPFYRQAIRVSMGAAFTIPLLGSDDLAGDLRWLGEHGIQRIATVLDERAEPLPAARRPQRIALLFGNEAQGLRPDILKLCDRRVTIPMQLGADSLNVASAAAVVLYHFMGSLGQVSNRPLW